MKKSIKRVIALIVLLAIIFVSGVVNAASVSMSLASDSKLVAGDTVIVTLKISSIDAGDGVDAIVGTLNYDKNVFDQVTDENFEGLNRWNIQTYNDETGIFTATRSSKVNMASDVLKVTLKAKAAVTVNSTSIEVKELTASGGAVDMGGTGDIKVNNVSVTVNKASQIRPNPDDKTNQQQGGQENTEKPVNKQSPIVNSNNTPSTKLPQTGEEYGIVLGIAVVAIVSIIAYVRYRNVNIK